MREVGMWIDHRPVEGRGGESVMVENPATEETIGAVPRGRAADIGAAVDAARRAQPAWRRMPGLDKAKLMHEVAGRMRSMHRELAELMTLEGGKPMIENLDEIEWVTA